MVVGIVDTGVGTTASMHNMFRHIGAEAEVTSVASRLDRFSHLVLPGVGHYTEGASRLVGGGWVEPIRAFVASGKPVLGVCLGMQLLGVGSQEGEGAGLGLLPYFLEKIPVQPGVTVPHMGWNTVSPTHGGSPLIDADEESRFYFVHSFAVSARDDTATGITAHGAAFASVVGRDNVFGVQFHPEKSHRFGMALLRNFVKVA